MGWTLLLLKRLATHQIGTIKIMEILLTGAIDVYKIISKLPNGYF
jgi:hypothetical protein